MSKDKNPIESRIEKIEKDIENINTLLAQGEGIIESLNKASKVITTSSRAIAKKGMKKNNVLDSTLNTIRFSNANLNTTLVKLEIKKYLEEANKYKGIKNIVSEIELPEIKKMTSNESRISNQLNSGKLIGLNYSIGKLYHEINKIQSLLVLRKKENYQNISQIKNDQKFEEIEEKIDKLVSR